MDDPSDLSILKLVAPDAKESEMRQWTTLLDGTVDEAAERIHRLHNDLGISFFTVNATPGTSWDTLKKLVDAVR
jgi:hypothetical protein